VQKPLPDFTCEPGLVLFPPELVPGVGHPLIDKLGNDATRRLTMRKLESYDAFTEKLEYKAVMAASIKIAQNPQAYYSPERERPVSAPDSFPTLNLMERAGVLDHPAARPAFVEQKLID
jgi:hypothetical protein